MSILRRFGWIPDLPDHRDHYYGAPFARTLPTHVDLRPGMPPVYDQGDLGSCTAQAIAAAIQYNQRRQALPDVTPSRLFIYYQERVLEHSVREDAGAMIRDGIKVCAKLGVVPEPLWPYDVRQFATAPPSSAYEEALHHQILRYGRVSNSVRGLKSVLASGYPVVFGFAVYESFMTPTVEQTGVVPMPDVNEAQLGGHAVLCVGYEPEGFLVRNSWGDGWGQAGHCRMPYTYLTDDNLSDDFWVIRLTE